MTKAHKSKSRQTFFVVAAILVIAVIALALHPRRQALLIDFNWTQQHSVDASVVHFAQPTSIVRLSGFIDSMLLMQAKPLIAKEFQNLGWRSARGEVAVYTLGSLPLVLGLDRTVDWKIVDPEESPLMQAADEGDARQTKELLAQGQVVNAQDQRGLTALMHASRKNSKDCVEVVRLLVTSGTNLNTTDKFGRTALYWAVVDGIRINIVRILVHAGAADVNVTDRQGKSVLIEAVGSGGNEDEAREAAEILIKAGAHTDVAMPDGQTALSSALSARRESIVRLLKQSGEAQ